ncbi:hypothetical protein ACHQM5_029350 [Ranunculus cassubicifolius]
MEQESQNVVEKVILQENVVVVVNHKENVDLSVEEESLDDVEIVGGEAKEDNVVDVGGERNELRPRIGMEFKSEEEAYDYYCTYALKNGFSVRKNSTCRSRTRSNELIGRSYVCSRQGVKEVRMLSREPPNKGRGEYRTGCKAYITVRKRDRNEWVVTKYFDEHNHEMDSPSEMHVHRALKKRTEAKEKMLEKMCMSVVKMSPVVDGVVPKVGESSNVGYVKKGGRNGLSRKRQTEIKREDVDAILNFFEKQQTEDRTFFYSIQVDSEGQLTNFFWTDAKSRMDYHHFGDAVCFEPSYEINRSGLPFVPILGINNHCQIVLFGSALLFTDSEESFEWLVRAWMNAMNGKEPKIVLTGNDSPIEEVIERVFPGCCHRFSTWKVIQNAKKNLGDVINAHEDFIHEFTNCVNNYDTVECFESNWIRMVERYGVRDNNWVVKLFENRRKWAPAYSNGIFLASMFNNQHTEDKSIYFEDYLKEDMPLSEFVKKFHKLLLEKREKEREEFDYTSPSLRFSIDIETDAANSYTKEIFQKFQEQLFEGISYRHKKVAENGLTSTYSVWKTGQEKLGYSVSFDYSTISAKCSCQLFESAGYLCRHVLKIFLIENVQNLLPQYILKRWTKDAKSGSIVSDQGEIMLTSCENIAVRYSNLFDEAINISDKGSSSMEAFEVAIQCLHNTVKEVEVALKKVITPTICNREAGQQNNDISSQGRVEKSSDDQNNQPVPGPVKGGPEVMNPRSDKLPVKKSSTCQTMQNKSQNLTRYRKPFLNRVVLFLMYFLQILINDPCSSQTSFTTDEIRNEHQQKRRKVGKFCNFCKCC